MTTRRVQGGGEAPVGDEAAGELAARLDGDVLRSGDDGYDSARRVWNGLIDRRPALIARCASTDDVRAAVRFAREHELVVAVRGGGHGVAGNAVCDGGLVIDLSHLNDVHVDVERRVVRAGGGCRLADVDAATQEHGLATPLGVVSETGIAGLTLAGGMGWLRRKHGLSCDNLLAAELVTADGGLVHTSESDNAELLWGLRGGGGNFGIVTAFELQLHELGPDVELLFVVYPGDRAREVLATFVGLMADAPDEISLLSFLGRVPEADMFPAESHGRPMVAIAGIYAGPTAEAEPVLRPFRELGGPIADLSGRMPFTEVQSLLDEDYPAGGGYYWKSIELDGLDGTVIDRLVEHAAAAPSAHSTVDVWYHGGAMGRVAPDATAFGERALVLLGYEANFEDLDAAEPNVAWVRDSLTELSPYARRGTYLNFPGFFEEGDALVRDSYGDANYRRLVQLKDAWDPDNVFRLNGNIAPSA
jgi:FAD/FMN-containing dehydrogenase